MSMTKPTKVPRGGANAKFLDAFSDRTTTTNAITNTYQDSFNRVNTSTDVRENLGNTSLNLGGGGGVAMEAVPVVAVVGVLALAGIYLVTKR